MPFIISGKSAWFVMAEAENGIDGIKDSHIHLMPKRKRSMTETNDTNFMVGRKKTKLHDERGSLGNDNSLKLELNSVQGCLGKVGGGSSLQIASRKSLFDGTDDSNDCSSNDSEDESCLDSCMDKIVASFKR